MVLSCALSKWCSFFLNWDTNTWPHCPLKGEETCYSLAYKEHMTLSLILHWPDFMHAPLSNSRKAGKYCLPLCLRKENETDEQIARLCHYSGRKSRVWAFPLCPEYWKPAKTCVQISIVRQIHSKWKPDSVLHLILACGFFSLWKHLWRYF